MVTKPLQGEKMRTTMLLLIVYGFLAQLMAEYVLIGTGTSKTSSVPMVCNDRYSYTQTIYYQSEIARDITISKIAYQYTGASWTNQDIKIYMGYTQKFSFSSLNDWVPTPDLSLVFSGSVTTSSGWVEIPLTTPFHYDGFQNLVIAFDENDPGLHSYNDDFYGTISSDIYRSLIFTDDYVNPDPAIPPYGTRKNRYANIKLFEISPVFNIEPTSNNYNNLVVNSTKLKNFTIKNTGIGYLDITNSDIKITGTDPSCFSLGMIAFPIHLAANETAVIPVKFTPKTAGEKSANLEITDNINKSVHNVTLTGTAYNAFTTPFIENFESVWFPPHYWQDCCGILAEQTVLVPSNSGWNSSFFSNVQDNGRGAKINVFGNKSSWLVTPEINLGSINRGLRLKLDVALTGYNVSSTPDLDGIDDKFCIVISNDGGTTWTSANILRQYDNSEESIYKYNSFRPEKTNIAVPLGAQSGIIKIGFYAESTISNADNDLHIDNVVLESSSLVGNYNHPESSMLNQNYPNPFNPVTKISYELKSADNVVLSIFNTNGEQVKTIVDEYQNVGQHSILFDASKMNTGIYFYTLKTNSSIETKKMILVK